MTDGQRVNFLWGRDFEMTRPDGGWLLRLDDQMFIGSTEREAIDAAIQNEEHGADVARQVSVVAALQVEMIEGAA